MLPIGIELIISVQSNWKRKKLKAIIEVRDISGQSNGKQGESIKAWEDKGIWQRAPRRSSGNTAGTIAYRNSPFMLDILLQIGVDDKDWIMVGEDGGCCISCYIFV